MFTRICAFFLAAAQFFTVLFAGYIRYYPHNRIFLDQYYTEARSERQMYDLVIPRSASGSTGLILCIHGGAWVAGSKSSYTDPIMQYSNNHGFAAACINYRFVSETVGFDEQLDDISSALEAIRAKGKAYGVDFDKVMLTGISAGGHLSLLYAYSRKDAAPVKPVCVVEFCGPTDLAHPFYYSAENSLAQTGDEDFVRNILSRGIKFSIFPDDFDAAKPALQKYSPIHFVNADTVPTVFAHGEQDTIVPYQNAIDLDETLTVYGVEHTFVSFPNSGHGCEDEASMSRMMTLFFDYAEKYLK